MIHPLSPKELEILYHLKKGYSNAEVAEALGISVNTVKTHLKHIFRKLEVHNRTAAVMTSHVIE